MNAGTTKGWCPSLMTPMEAGDGLLVRVKPRAATLTAEQAKTVAAASRRCGNGIVELTNRGHLQLRGLSQAGVEDLCRSMAEVGLAGRSPRAEAIRNILADPLGPDDPGARFDSHRLARDLSAVLEDDRSLHGLPDKFGILVDAGVALPLVGSVADIMVRSDGDGAAIALDGGDRRLALPFRDVEDAVWRLLSAFLSWAGQVSPAPRMKAMVAACGTEAVFDAAGLRGEKYPESIANKPSKRPHPGFMRVPGSIDGCFLIGTAFGGLEAERLANLADLARTFSDGTIRLTPWKAVVLPGVSRSHAPALRDRASEAGLVVQRDDPRSRIVACAGRPRCASAEADTRADAGFFLSAGAAPQGLLHVSGCAKGCAHPSPAPFTLVAKAGRYDLVRDGRADGTPERTGLTPREAAWAMTPTLEPAGFDSKR